MKSKILAQLRRARQRYGENPGGHDRTVRRGLSLILAAVFLAFAACLANSQVPDSGDDGEDGLAQPPESGYSVPAFPFKKADRETDQSNPTATIAFIGTGAQISGEGAAFASGVLTISAGGVYVISGTLADGQIRIDAGKKESVRLVLSGVTLTNRKGAAIYAKSAKKLVITVVGTNSLHDGGSSFAYEDSKNEEPNAAVYAACDLTFNGDGSLEVEANFSNAIQSKDLLCFISGTYEIAAASNGLVGKDGVAIEAGSFRVRAASDGIRSKGNNTPQRGYVLTGGGTFDITAGGNAVKANTVIAMLNTTFDARTLPGSTQKSPKGLSGAYVFLSDVNMTFNTADDAMNAIDVDIRSGKIVITSGDDAIHADGILNIFDGEITVLSCHEGLEGNQVNISGGTIIVNALEDGVNAAGGTDSNSGAFGADTFTGTGPGIRITGGDITVIALSDGLDSNGSISITGGNVVVFSLEGGLTVNALHSTKETIVSGGTIAFGGTNPGKFSPSTQGYVFLPSSVKKGDKVTVYDASKEIYSFTSPSDVMRLAISTPKIQANRKYTVGVNDLKSEIVAGSSMDLE